MSIKELYESLKGTRVVNGELTIPDFTAENYEELYYLLLEELAGHIGDNYEYWYLKVANWYHSYKKRRQHSADFYDPHISKEVWSQSIREQLAVLKYYLQKRAYSRYPKKGVKE